MIYKEFPKKELAMKFIDTARQNDPQAAVKLFAKDLDWPGKKTKGGEKRHIVSTDRDMHDKMFTESGDLRNLFNNYEWIHLLAKFGVDLDIVTRGNLYGPEYDCTQDIIDMIRQIQEKFSAVFDRPAQRWIFLKSPYKQPDGDKKGKHSYRCILLDYVFPDMKTMKCFANGLDGDGIDTSFYQSRCNRLVGNTKLGENRPMMPHKIESEHFVSLMPDDFRSHLDYFTASLISNSNDCERLICPEEWSASLPDRVARTAAKNPDNFDEVVFDEDTCDGTSRQCDIDPETVLQLAKCLSAQRADSTYNDWRDIGFAIASAVSGDNERKLYDAFVAFSQKSPKYDKAETRKQWKACRKRRCTGSSIGIGTLFNAAKKDDKTAYNKVIRHYHIPNIVLKELEISFPQVEQNKIHEETFATFEKDGVQIDYLTYQDRYLRPYPLEGYDGVIVRSPPGTGKTEVTLDPMSKAKRSICVIPRRTLTMASEVRYQEAGIHNVSYMDEKKTFDLSKFAKLLVSPESIWKVWKDRKYEFFNGDEIETIFESLTCEKTNVNMPGAHTAFVECFIIAKFFALCDAFISRKCLEYVRATCKGKRILFINNIHKPFSRKAIQIRHDIKNFQNIHKAWPILFKKIADDIKAQRNVGVFTGNKSGFGDALYNYLITEGIVTEDEIKYYHKDNVNFNTKIDMASWKNYKIVLYTPVISVGNNCDIDHFDVMYAYLSCNTINVKGSVQAISRIRNIRTNKLIFMVDDLMRRTDPVTVETMTEKLQHIKALKREAYEREISQTSAVSVEELQDLLQYNTAEEVKQLLQDRVEKTMKGPMRHMDDLDFRTLVLNELQKSVDNIHFEGILHYFLRQTGYDEIIEEFHHVDSINAPSGRPKADTQNIFGYEELPMLTKRQAAELQMKKRDGSLERHEVLALQKHIFVQNMIIDKQRQVSEEDRARIFNQFTKQDTYYNILLNIYNFKYKTPLEMMRSDLARCAFTEVSVARGSVAAKFDDLVQGLGLKGFDDRMTVIRQDSLEDSFEELLKSSQDIRVLLNRPAKTTQAELRSLIDSLDVCFRCLGLQLTVAEQHRIRIDGRRIWRKSWKLCPSDSFSKLLFESGLF